jgi:hypothetical protein
MDVDCNATFSRKAAASAPVPSVPTVPISSRNPGLSVIAASMLAWVTLASLPGTPCGPPAAVLIVVVIF